MEGEHVAPGEQLLQGDPPAAGGLLFRAAVHQDLHAQGLAKPGHFRPDVAVAQDAQGFPGEFHHGAGGVAHGYGIVPVPAAHRMAEGVDLAAQAQQQGEGVLGHGVHAVKGHVAQGDAPLPGGGAVHLVDADGQGADVGKFWQGVQDLPGEPYPVDDDGLGVLGPVQHQLRRGVGVDGEGTQGL